MVLSLALLSTSVYAGAVIGVKKRVDGEVTIKRGEDRLTAGPGTLVERGDPIITTRTGYASIVMRRAVQVTVGPNNDVVLDRFAPQERPAVQGPAPPLLQGLASFLALNRQT